MFMVHYTHMIFTLYLIDTDKEGRIGLWCIKAGHKQAFTIFFTLPIFIYVFLYPESRTHQLPSCALCIVHLGKGIINLFATLKIFVAAARQDHICHLEGLRYITNSFPHK